MVDIHFHIKKIISENFSDYSLTDSTNTFMRIIFLVTLLIDISEENFLFMLKFSMESVCQFTASRESSKKMDSKFQ